MKRVALKVARTFGNVRQIKDNFFEIELENNVYIYVDAESYYYRLVIDQEVARIYFRDKDFEELIEMLKNKWITENDLRRKLNSIAREIIRLIKAAYRPYK